VKGSKASFKSASQLQSAARERALTSSRNDAKEGENARSTKHKVLVVKKEEERRGKLTWQGGAGKQGWPVRIG